MVKPFISVLISLVWLTGCQTGGAPRQPIPRHHAPEALCGAGEMMMQTTLWLSATGEPEWQQFLHDKLISQFGNALTVYNAAGKDELRRVVVLLYQPDARYSATIDRLRKTYRDRFGLKTATRIDSLVCASAR